MNHSAIHSVTKPCTCCVHYKRVGKANMPLLRRLTAPSLVLFVICFWTLRSRAEATPEYAAIDVVTDIVSKYAAIPARSEPQQKAAKLWKVSIQKSIDLNQQGKFRESLKSAEDSLLAICGNDCEQFSRYKTASEIMSRRYTLNSDNIRLRDTSSNVSIRRFAIAQNGATRKERHFCTCTRKPIFKLASSHRPKVISNRRRSFACVTMVIRIGEPLCSQATMRGH